MAAEHVTTTLDQVEQWLKVGGFAGGALFFAWKLFTGWLIINLKVSVKLDRAAKSPDEDHLGITVAFEKGTTDSIWLKHVSVRATWPGNADPDPLDMSEELNWLGINGGRIAWDQHETAAGTIALSPGESTTFARTTTVPSEAAVTVEVAAYGKRNFWPRGFQWRASAVSLPLPKPPTANP